MGYSIITQYKQALKRSLDIEQELDILPCGYISKKVICGKAQHYLQRRIGKKIVGRYIPGDEVEAIRNGLLKRSELTEELSQVKARVFELEAAAKLVDKNDYNYLLLLKVCLPMEDLSNESRMKASSFAGSMNAVEGVYATEETQSAVSRWINGEESFLSVYESTLRKYGFPVEVR